MNISSSAESSVPDRVGTVATLSLAHLVNDWYMNFPQVLLPFLAASGLAVSKGAFLVSAFTITSSLLQPVFGWWADRKGRRFPVFVGTAWMALCMGAIACTQGYVARLVLIGLAGLGTAAFHPQASALVARSSGSSKGFWQGIFIASGNVGWALSPLLLVPFLQRFGLPGIGWCALPGLAMALVLVVMLRGIAPSNSRGAQVPDLGAVLSRARGTLLRILAVVALRSWAYFGIIAFLPLYLQKRQIGLASSSRLLFVMLFTGALGGLCGGFWSDRLAARDGRRRILAGSLLLATPALLLALRFSGTPLGSVILGLAGALALASFSITVVLAQQALGRAAALASGLTLGFGVGIGGLGVGFTGLLVERFGISAAMTGLCLLPFVGGLLALRIRPAASAAN